MNQHYDIIIAGAGITGCTIARQFAERKHHVLLLEKKSHIGGAAYDYLDPCGMYVHEYGPHIFHTNSEEVVHFVQKFGIWKPYQHKVAGCIDGIYIPVPFNYKSIETCFDPETASSYIELLNKYFIGREKITITDLRQAGDGKLSTLADFIYEKVFYHYTLKQWGMPPEDLSLDVLNRVPVRLSYNNNYFDDLWQLIPENGYTNFLSEVISHKNITLKVDCNADKLIEYDGNTMFFGGNMLDVPLIYTGCIDRLAKYHFNMLPYRTLRFIKEKKEWPFQSTAVVNYPSASVQFTRISEYGHFYPKMNYKNSVIMYEYPLEYMSSDKNEPYYPIENPQNLELYNKYKAWFSNARFFYTAGRLGGYHYINMDTAIIKALELSDAIISTNKIGGGGGY